MSCKSCKEKKLEYKGERVVSLQQFGRKSDSKSEIKLPEWGVTIFQHGCDECGQVYTEIQRIDVPDGESAFTLMYRF